MTQRSAAFFGYFDAPHAAPAFDPRDTVPCLFCMNPLLFHTGTIRTISLMRLTGAEDGNRSYFYRVHRMCDDAISQEEKALYEEAVTVPVIPAEA